MSIQPINLSTSLSLSNYTPSPQPSAPAQLGAPLPGSAVSPGPQAPGGQRAQSDKEAYLEKVNNHVNDALKASDAEFLFSVHKSDDRVMIRLVDSSTHEVLREIPSEKYLDMVDQLSKLAGKLVGLHTDVSL